MNIPYEFFGQPHVYEPDFLVRFADDSHLLLEIKGAAPAEVAAKYGLHNSVLTRLA